MSCEEFSADAKEERHRSLSTNVGLQQRYVFVSRSKTKIYSIIS